MSINLRASEESFFNIECILSNTRKIELVKETKAWYYFRFESFWMGTHIFSLLKREINSKLNKVGIDSLVITADTHFQLKERAGDQGYKLAFKGFGIRPLTEDQGVQLQHCTNLKMNEV